MNNNLLDRDPTGAKMTRQTIDSLDAISAGEIRYCPFHKVVSAVVAPPAIKDPDDPAETVALQRFAIEMTRSSPCVGSRCMAYRTAYPVNDSGEEIDGSGLGACGLVSATFFYREELFSLAKAK